MARPRVIDDEDLLESLRNTFLELGPTVPTTELAARAKVSEGTLFKRFGSKKSMFDKAMAPPELEGAWYDEMVERAGTGDLRENLAVIATGIEGYLSDFIPRVFCAYGGRPSVDDIRQNFGEISPNFPIRIRLTRYFELECAAGRVRPLPARHLAELLFGALNQMVVTTVLFPAEAQQEPTGLDAQVAELVATFYAMVAV